MTDNEWLKEHLDKIEAKIDKLDDKLENMDNRVNSVDVTLAKQSVILDDHTRRSLANEQQVELLKKKIEVDIKPLQKHVYMVNGIFKIIGLSSSIVSLIFGIVKLLGLF